MQPPAPPLPAADSALVAALPPTAADPGGRAADPVNVVVVAAPADLARAFAAAGWRPARPLGVRADARLAEAVVLDRPDPDAPVSTLVLYGRPQAVAFERETVRGSRRRHHVRLWRVPGPPAPDGVPRWAAAATFDSRIGVHGDHPTHHIARHVDAERDSVGAALGGGGWVRARWLVPGRVPRQGRDGANGDAWLSDGRVLVVRLGPPAAGRGSAKP